MTANNHDYTLHPYDTDAIEFPIDAIDNDTTKSIENYLQYQKDVALRYETPALKEAWNKYQVLLTLFRNGKDIETGVHYP